MEDFDSSWIQNVSAASSSSINYTHYEKRRERTPHELYLLNSIFIDLEIRWNITSKHSSFERFDMPANVSFTSDKVALEYTSNTLFMAVRHNDRPSISLDLHTHV
jgi:hypothetical protein